MNTPGELIDANGTASIAVSGVPSPVLTGQCSAIGFGCESDATLAYFFEVVPLDGDTNQTAIDPGINAAGSISVDTSGNSQSTNSNIELIVGTGPGGSFFDDLAQVDYNAGCDSGVTPPCSAVDDSSSNDNGFVSTPGVDGSTLGAPGQSYIFGGINESGTYGFVSNEQYEVSMTVDLDLEGGSGTATLDPTLTAPSGYEVIFSDGIGNSLTTPEPGSWAAPFGCGSPSWAIEATHEETEHA